MRTRDETVMLVRTRLEFSGDATLRGRVWTDVRRAYLEALQEAGASGRRDLHDSIANHHRTLLFAAAAVLGLAVLLGYRIFIENPRRPSRLPVKTTARDPNVGKTADQQASLAREWADARHLFERKDLAGLMQLLAAGQPQTKIQVAEYLGQIGDDSVLSALQMFAEQWQGPAEDNPFRKAMEAIQQRQTDAASEPTTDEGDPNAAAGAPPDKVESTSAGEAAQLQVAGIVIDKETRRPIPGAQVGLRLGTQTTADSEGRFTLAWTRPSSNMLYLHAAAPGYATSMIAARTGTESTRDVIIALSPGSKLAVTVVEPNGAPIPGAKVSLLGLESQEWNFATDADGQFEFDGLDPVVRSYGLHVTHPGHPARLINVQPGPAGRTLHQRVVLSRGVMVLGQVTDPNGRPVVGATVGNTTSAIMWNCLKARTNEHGQYQLGAVDTGELVLWATHERHAPFVTHMKLEADRFERRVDIQLGCPRVFSGRVVDVAGRPVPQAKVKMWGYHELTDLVAAEHPCDASGRFTIPNAPAEGELELLIGGPGVARTRHKVDPALGECLITAPLIGRIYGRVSDAATGKPIPRFKVKMDFSQVAAPSGGFATSWSKEGYTFESPEGLFDTGIDEPPVGGSYWMAVYAEGYDPVALDPVVAQPISNNPVRTEFRLPPATVFAGRILATDGRPLEGAIVVFFSNGEVFAGTGRWPSTATNKAGVYTIAGLGSEPQCMVVSAPGFAPRVFVMVDLLVASGRLADIVLEPAASIVGRVVDEQGRSVTNAHIQAQPSLKNIRGILRLVPNLGPTTCTDENGRYRLSGLPTGRVSILVFSLSEGQRRIGHNVVDLKPGETMTLDFVDEGEEATTGAVGTVDR